MRSVVIGSVMFSEACLGTLLGLPDAGVAGVVTARGAAGSDRRSLAPLARAHGIPCLEVAPGDQGAVARFVRTREASVAFCVGWPRLLHEDVLRSAPQGVVGYHPAALPRHRGRHPIIWALALGLRETASTFFFLDPSADAGDIIDQRPVPIGPDDEAGDLYGRITAVAQRQLEDIVPLLARGVCPRVPQDPTRATAWRKRSPADGRIDWRMGAGTIRNLVRALASPYPGATIRHAGREHPVWRVAVAGSGDAHPEPGRVLATRGRTFRVQCGDGSVWVEEHGLDATPEPGECL